MRGSSFAKPLRKGLVARHALTLFLSFAGCRSDSSPGELARNLGLGKLSARRTFVVLATAGTCLGCLNSTLEVFGHVVSTRPQQAQGVLVLVSDQPTRWGGKLPPGVRFVQLPAAKVPTLPISGLPQFLVFDPSGQLLGVQRLPPNGVGLEAVEAYFLLED